MKRENHFFKKKVFGSAPVSSHSTGKEEGLQGKMKRTRTVTFEDANESSMKYQKQGT